MHDSVFRFLDIALIAQLLLWNPGVRLREQNSLSKIVLLFSSIPIFLAKLRLWVLIGLLFVVHYSVAVPSFEKKMNAGIHFWHIKFSSKTLPTFQPMKNHQSFIQIVPCFGLRLISAMSSRHSFRPICVCGAVLWQSGHPTCSDTRLSARPFAQNSPVTSSYNIVFALATIALLESTLAAKTDHSSMPFSNFKIL